MTISVVTGACGFIGSHVAEHLLKMGHKVICLDHLEWGTLDNIPFMSAFYDCWMNPLTVAGDEMCTFVKGSITSPETIDRLFKRWPIDYVFHLAAYAAEGLSPFIARFNYHNNVIGSVNLINAAVNHGVKRFVFTSSAAVYGDRATDGATEEQTPTPIDPYGIAKWTVEQHLAVAARLFGLEYTIFRPHNVYGPRQNLNDGYRNVIGIFMRQCLKGEELTVYGDGTQTRQFSYIGDVAPYIAQSVEHPRAVNQTYNIGSDRFSSILYLANRVGEAMDGYQGITFLPERHEARDVRLDHQKFRNEFETGLPTYLNFGGLKKMAEWAKTQTLREPRAFTQIEIEKGLPEHWRKLNVRT